MSNVTQSSGVRHPYPTIAPTQETTDAMASIRKDIPLESRPEDVWAVLRDTGAVHEWLAPGYAVDTRMDGDARIVTFANGVVVRELIVDVDDIARRIAYSVVEGPLGTTHQHASMQVLADGRGGSHLVWITDLAPDELAPTVREMVDRGAEVMKRALDRVPAPA